MPNSLHHDAHQIIANMHLTHGSAPVRVGPRGVARLAAVALAAMVTLVTLAGVDGLAANEAAAPQLAQASSPRA